MSSLPRLEIFCPPELAGQPVFMVLPGGAYLRRADHEGAPVALWLNSIGLNAVVLHYAVAPEQPGTVLHPAPLNHARETLRWLRSGESGLGIDVSRIAVLGFSAGGHLAATLSTGAGGGADSSTDRSSTDRPDLSVLAYPVISLVSDCHQGSVEALLGPDPSWTFRRSLSAELTVDESTPPAFLWHTADDSSVPVTNSLAYAQALAQHGVPFELHIYPHGVHGLGLAPDQPGTRNWPLECARWLESHGWR